MRDSTVVPSGVVLDSVRARALLYLAVKEQLVDDDPLLGDGFVRNLTSRPPPTQVIEEALEQLVLGGCVYLPTWVPSKWEGEPFSDEIFIPLESRTEETLLEIPEYPREAIIGLLNMTGNDWPEDLVAETERHFLEIHRLWTTEAGGKSLGQLGLYRILNQAGLGIEIPQHTARELELWNAMDEAYKKASPILNAMREYQTVVTEAVELSALSSVPVAFSGCPSIKGNDPADGALTHAVLKVTCSGLGRTPRRATLAETIKLTQSAEAKVLRTKMAMWVHALCEGRYKDLEFIKEEIREAQEALSESRNYSKLSELATWVSGAMLPLTGEWPPAGPIGTVATVVGVFANYKQRRVASGYQWAMFNHRPTY
jgi:hypothetical protein